MGMSRPDGQGTVRSLRVRVDDGRAAEVGDSTASRVRALAVSSGVTRDYCALSGRRDHFPGRFAAVSNVDGATRQVGDRQGRVNSQQLVDRRHEVAGGDRAIDRIRRLGVGLIGRRR